MVTITTMCVTCTALFDINTFGKESQKTALIFLEFISTFTIYT